LRLSFENIEMSSGSNIHSFEICHCSKIFSCPLLLFLIPLIFCYTMSSPTPLTNC
jgi:hypothetical protein